MSTIPSLRPEQLAAPRLNPATRRGASRPDLVAGISRSLTLGYYTLSAVDGMVGAIEREGREQERAAELASRVAEAEEQERKLIEAEDAGGSGHDAPDGAEGNALYVYRRARAARDAAIYMEGVASGAIEVTGETATEAVDSIIEQARSDGHDPSYLSHLRKSLSSKMSNHFSKTGELARGEMIEASVEAAHSSLVDATEPGVFVTTASASVSIGQSQGMTRREAFDKYVRRAALEKAATGEVAVVRAIADQYNSLDPHFFGDLTRQAENVNAANEIDSISDRITRPRTPEADVVAGIAQIQEAAASVGRTGKEAWESDIRGVARQWAEVGNVELVEKIAEQTEAPVGDAEQLVDLAKRSRSTGIAMQVLTAFAQDHDDPMASVTARAAAVSSAFQTLRREFEDGKLLLRDYSEATRSIGSRISTSTENTESTEFLVAQVNAHSNDLDASPISPGDAMSDNFAKALASPGLYGGAILGMTQTGKIESILQPERLAIETSKVGVLNSKVSSYMRTALSGDGPRFKEAVRMYSALAIVDPPRAADMLNQLDHGDRVRAAHIAYIVSQEKPELISGGKINPDYIDLVDRAIAVTGSVGDITPMTREAINAEAGFSGGSTLSAQLDASFESSMGKAIAERFTNGEFKSDTWIGSLVGADLDVVASRSVRQKFSELFYDSYQIISAYGGSTLSASQRTEEAKSMAANRLMATSAVVRWGGNAMIIPNAPQWTTVEGDVRELLEAKAKAGLLDGPVGVILDNYVPKFTGSHWVLANASGGSDLLQVRTESGAVKVLAFQPADMEDAKAEKERQIRAAKERNMEEYRKAQERVKEIEDGMRIAP